MGERIDFNDSVRIIEAITKGELDNAETYQFNCFDFAVPKRVEGIDESLMKPRKNWNSEVEYN